MTEEEITILMQGDERIYTFGGECSYPDFTMDEYGIDFGRGVVCGLTSRQMLMLVKSAVDHLILNGHKFQIKETNEQDQVYELIHS
jgi:hypothetical protein